jgi:hypothetical protein
MTRSSSSKKKSKYPSFSLGSDEAIGSGKDALRGKWRKYKNPIKTYDAMLRTVGVNVSKQTVKGIGKLDKSFVSIDKLMFKQPHKRYNRVKQRRTGKR